VLNSLYGNFATKISRGLIKTSSKASTKITFIRIFVTYLGRGLNKPRPIFSRINGTNVSDLLQVTYFGNNYLSPSFWL
jgi:hypothetical protein